VPLPDCVLEVSVDTPVVLKFCFKGSFDTLNVLCIV